MPTTPHSQLPGGGTSGQFLYVLWICSVDENTELRPAPLWEVGPMKKKDIIPVDNLPEKKNRYGTPDYRKQALERKGMLLSLSLVLDL